MSTRDAFDINVLFDLVLERFNTECEPEFDEDPSVPKVDPDPPDCVLR